MSKELGWKISVGLLMASGIIVMLLINNNQGILQFAFVKVVSMIIAIASIVFAVYSIYSISKGK